MRALRVRASGAPLMLTPLLHITLPENDEDERGTAEDRHVAPILFALDAVIGVNIWHMRRANKRTLKGRGVPVPPLYASGVRYQEDPPGREDWCDCYAVLAKGTGDCDQLTAYRVAELRVAGIPAEPVIKYQMVPRAQMIASGYPANMIPGEGILMIHCAVRGPRANLVNPEQQPDGTWVEDTSKNLGMGGTFTNGV